jgi:ubiquinone/menaquinone biosynthesis C-methylase UbiE
METLKDHWERIYATKKRDELSWTQNIPKTSLDFLHGFNLSKDSSIIDIGGGESNFVDFLLDEGFTDITVLDISEHALQKTKDRLGNKAHRVKWIVSDITKFRSKKKYHVWHDRATFHFLTTENQIGKYISLASALIDKNGFMTIGTFSENGPVKCSGLIIRQYSEQLLNSVLKVHFKKMQCITEDHETSIG